MYIKTSTLAGLVLLAASQPANAVVINFNYSYDGGFFSGANQGRQSILEAAGGYLGSILSDSLAAITSNGSNHFDAVFDRPDTGVLTTLSNFNVAPDTLTVFVGGRNLGSGTLGVGGPGGYSVGGNSTYVNTAPQRGQSGVGSSDFAPWGGQISFSTVADWYFDSDLSTSESFTGNDFYSVALHELGHVLGLGTAGSWNNQVSGSSFNGANAVAAYGALVPLQGGGDTGHWQEGTQSTVNGVLQEALLDPTITTGTRKLFTKLDLAALQDVGWQVSAAAVPLPSALWLFGTALFGFAATQRKQYSRR